LLFDRARSGACACNPSRFAGQDRIGGNWRMRLFMSPPLLHGTLLEGRYEIISSLGEGGFGVVYKARQISTGQPVAIKIMRQPDHGSAEELARRARRFQREMELCAQLHHPNVVQLIDAGRTEAGLLYGVFSFEPGETLADVLAREGTLDLNETRHLMLQVLDALACAHARGVIHRDLKPRNIMVNHSGARRNAVVLDFGIGALALGHLGRDHTRLTGTNEVLGTPGYAAPEQLRGLEPSPRSDVFSWGLIFVECLTGKRVYTGGSAPEIIYAQLGGDDVPIPPMLEQHPLGELLRRALHKDVAAREVTTRELILALEAASLRALEARPLLHGGLPSPVERKTPQQGNTVTLPSTGEVGDAAAVPRIMIEGERRQLTALCCALEVHATGSRPLDDEEVEELLRFQLVTCAQIAQRHHGHVAAALGDQILVYFGFPHAAEGDAQRAARAALAMTAAIQSERERLAAQRGLALDARIGIHTGLVSTRDPGGGISAGLVVGATASVAARACRAAPPGLVAVTPEAQRVLRASFDLTPAHVMEGSAGPVPLYRLGPQRREHLPTPTPASPKTPLVGREHEMELLLDRWRRVRQGAGQSILITGEPGIGKSRLGSELRDRLLAEAHGFLEGRCSPDAQNDVLHAVVDLLGRALGLDPQAASREKITRIEAALAAHGFVLAELMPLFLPLFDLPTTRPYAPLDLSPQRQKELTLEAILSLLFAMAEKQPLLVTIEDLHWADATTLELLGKLLAEAPSAAVCLIMTARTEFSPPFALSGVLQLQLGRLEPLQVEILTQRLVGKKLPANVLALVAERTDGVPLFVEELVRMMVESGALAEREDGYELVRPLSAAGIPGTLHSLLTARLDRLGQAKETAQIAAALGREFSGEVLAAVSPHGSAALQEALDRLVSAGIIHRKRRLRDVGYVFKHALIRDAAYESLPRATRVKVHALIARTLEERFLALVESRPDLLAYHHAAAEQKRTAIEYAQRAALHALQHSAYAEALGHVRGALDWLDGIPDARARAEAELGLNRIMTPAIMATRGYAARELEAVARRSLDIIDSIGESPYTFGTLWNLCVYHHVRAEHGQALARMSQCLELAEHAQDIARQAAILPLLGESLMLQGNLVEARVRLEAALALYDPVLCREHVFTLGQDARVYAHSVLGLILCALGFPDQGREHGKRAVAWATELEHANSLGLALTYLGGVWQYRREPEPAREICDALVALAERHGLPQWAAMSGLLRGWADGIPEEAEKILDGFRPMGFGQSMAYWGSTIAESEAARGRLDAAVQRLDWCLHRANEVHEMNYVAEIYRLKGTYLLEHNPGERPEAEKCFRQAIAVAREQEARLYELRATIALCRSRMEQEDRAEPGALLGPIHAWFTEGHDMRELAEARGLVAELGHGHS
jgi:TOMM system kinase/cyclase fusion protein